MNTSVTFHFIEENKEAITFTNVYDIHEGRDNPFILVLAKDKEKYYRISIAKKSILYFVVEESR